MDIESVGHASARARNRTQDIQRVVETDSSLGRKMLLKTEVGQRWRRIRGSIVQGKESCDLLCVIYTAQCLPFAFVHPELLSYVYPV